MEARPALTRRGRLLAAAGLCATVFGSGAAHAEGEGGERRFALSVAQGAGLSIWGSEDEDAEDVRFAGLVPCWTAPLGGMVGADTWYRGRVELLLEGALLFAYGPHGGWLGGANALLRYRWLGFGRAAPFVELGAGAAYLDLDLDSQSDGVGFTPQGGLGLHWALSERTALTVAWRLHHVSNAGIYGDNVGINDSLVLIGVSWLR